jgi:hypothetical protein
VNRNGLHPQAPAGAATAEGCAGAGGFRVADRTSVHAEPALARRRDLVQFFGRFSSCTTIPHALDLPAETP